MKLELVNELACLALFLGMLLASELGRRRGRRRLPKEDTEPDVAASIIAAVFALLGLLIAFTFYGAYSRLDVRRQLIVQEANAIGTAYLRLDLLPLQDQASLRAKFREYAASRGSMYEMLPDLQAATSELAKATELGKQIWRQAVAATSGPAYEHVRLLLLPALNQMIDIVTTRTVAIQTHPPFLVFLTLYLLALSCAWATGYRGAKSQRRSRTYNILLAVVIAYVLFIILDMEYPAYGFIRLTKVNRVLIELGEMMK